MKTWDEFISWLDGFPKIGTLFADDGDEKIEAIPYGVMSESEEEAQRMMMTGLTDLINKCESVWIRWMPEINPLNNADGSPTGMFKGYMRIAYREKVAP